MHGDRRVLNEGVQQARQQEESHRPQNLRSKFRAVAFFEKGQEQAGHAKKYTDADNHMYKIAHSVAPEFVSVFSSSEQSGKDTRFSGLEWSHR
jgi:hypothetical protein